MSSVLLNYDSNEEEVLSCRLIVKCTKYLTHMLLFMNRVTLKVRPILNIGTIFSLAK